MRTISKILLAASLLTSASFSYAMPNVTTKIKAVNNSEDRHLSGFNAIDVAGSFDVFITQGSSESVRVEAPSDMISHILTEVNGGVLKIYSKHEWSTGNWFGSSRKKIAIYVTAKSLDAISLTGSGDVSFKGGIRANNLRLRLTGSGDVFGKVDVKTLDSSISGSGDVKISGHAETSNVNVVGSGDFSGHGLATSTTNVRVAGSGDASVNASSEIEASVTGSGDVHYSGSAHVTSKKTGSGDIERE